MKKKLSATVLSFITVFFIFTSIANAWSFGTRYARPSYSPSYRVNWTDWTQVLPDLQIESVDATAGTVWGCGVEGSNLLQFCDGVAKIYI